MKKILLFIIFIFIINKAEAVKLSSRAKVHLLIVGPYQGDFASIWGHIAVWVKDEPNNIDKIYNYGGAAFGGSFMYKMLVGELRYFLDVRQTYKQELKTYKRAKRDVDIHEINFNTAEKQKVFDLLEENSKEENKYYK